MLNVILLGLVSFFADISAEMVYPIIPLYLTSAFGATPVLVGVIEGIAESLASLLKVFSGFVTDKNQRKKPLAFLGYSTGIIYKLALLIATSWVGILAARIIDRAGKGIRTSPRDVMVSESAPKEKAGYAFGLHKALDMAGSAIGILLAFLILRSSTDNYKLIFAISIVPAVFSLLMFIKIKEKREKRIELKREKFWLRAKGLDSQLKLYLVVVLIFTLGNSSNAFLLLRARSVGIDDSSVILLYFLYNAVAALLSVPAGRLSDRVGRKTLLVSGYIVFSIVYFGFAFASTKKAMIILFAAYGIYTAMIAGVERAYISEISPKSLKGTMLGLHSTIAGLALLPASTLAGFVWTLYGPMAPFLLGASLSLAAAIILKLFMKPVEFSTKSNMS